MGTALHCLLLEPGEFDKRFIVSPKFDRRTKQGKADEEAFLRDVADMGITVLDAEQWRKLELMRDSAMAHPAARWMLEAPVTAKHQCTGTMKRRVSCAEFVQTNG